MTTFEQVRDAALGLEPALREELIDCLDESLHGPRSEIDELDDAAFEAELDRRHEEAMRDPSVLVPMDEMFAELENRIKNTSRVQHNGK
jgi:putative addiction module component (TIGR02574 family)